MVYANSTLSKYLVEQVVERMIDSLVEEIRWAKQSKTRFLAVVEGEWCCSVSFVYRLLGELSLPYQWVSDQREKVLQLADTQIITTRGVKQLLGSETTTLVYDLHCGFDPDVLGIISGLILGGHGLFLLIPPQKRWMELQNRCHQRIASYPCISARVKPNTFLRMLSRLAARAGTFWLEVTENEVDWFDIDRDNVRAYREKVGNAISKKDFKENPEQKEVSFTEPSRKPFGQFAINIEQGIVVEKVVNHVIAKKRSPIIVTANRGRGKSYAMGIAAFLLCQQRPCKIVVCSSRLASVDQIFASFIRCSKTEGCYRLDSDYRVDYVNVNGQKSTLEYGSQDRLLAEKTALDLLIVDEAASIPIFILERLLNIFHPIVFATTVHGYEGAGKGFVINFKKRVSEQYPQWLDLTLSASVRWDSNDSLEATLFDALLLDADIAEITPKTLRLIKQGEASIRYREWPVPSIKINNSITFARSLPALAIGWNESELQQIFGLLVQAHYQTRPLDLMRLLDIPDQRLIIAEFSGLVLGVLWAVEEGGYQGADELEEAIWLGKRRPNGHLVPHSLVCHEGIRSALSLTSLRITRIVVHPAVQGRGIGSKMIAQLRSLAKNQYDYLSTSYALTSDVLAFWHKNKFQLLRIGVQPDNISGLHSCMMGLAITEAGNSLFHRVKQKQSWQLPLNLLTGLANLELAVAIHFFSTLPKRPLEKSLKSNVISDVTAFAFGHRSYKTCEQSLWLYGWSDLFRLSPGACSGKKTDKFNLTGKGGVATPVKLDTGDISKVDMQLLVSRVVLRWSWTRVVKLTGFTGKKQCVRALREVYKQSLTG